MANEVEIKVKVRDHTGPGFDGVARKAKSELGRAGKDSGDGFNRGLTGAIGGMASKFFGNFAETASGIFSKQFGTAVSTNPYLGAGIAAGLGGAVAVTAPLVGSALAGGVVLAFGAGLAGLGMHFAAQSKKVKSAWKDTIDDVKKRMTEISKPFEPVLINISKMFRRTFDAFEPFLERAFKKMAKPVERFADALFKAFEELAPAIDPVTDAFIALMDSISPVLDDIFKGIADGIIDIANSIKDNPQTFTNLVIWMGEAIEKGLKFIAWLSRVANWFQEHPNVTKTLVGALKLLVAPITDVIDLFKTLSRWWDRISRFFSKEHRAKFGAKAESFFDKVGDVFAAGARFARRIWRATLGALNRTGSAIGSAVGAGLRWGRRVFRAAMSAVNRTASAIGSAISRGLGWARRTFNATLGARIGNVFSAVSRAVGAGMSWARRTFTATLNTVRNFLDFEHGGIVGAAGGGPRSNLVQVGEHGRELVRLPFGSTVIPNGQTENMLSGGGGGGSVTLEIRSGGSRLDDLIVEIIRKSVAAKGGNVQTALGR